MLLSDALSLGYLIEPPSNACSFRTCALGTAMACCGIESDKRHASTAIKMWPWLELDDPNGPAGRISGWRFLETIGFMYFNVREGLTKFEEIIDFVRRVEPPEPEEAAPPEPEPVAVMVSKT